MNENKIWGVLILVFILMNCFSIAGNIYVVANGNATEQTYVYMVFNALIIVLLGYIFMKYNLPMWRQPYSITR